MPKPTSRNSNVYYTFIAIVVVLPLIACRLGLEKEKSRYTYAASTLSKYTSSALCATYKNEESSNFTTVDHIEAKSQDMDIVHCGACGHCSTADDIAIMKNTKETLTKTATRCAYHGLIFGAKAVDTCLEKNIGFTPDCASCWSANVRCTIKNCVFNCIKSTVLKEPNNSNDKFLNSCLECDEKLCGPAFIECAGANRRRLGIASDIVRDLKQEQCQLVDYEVDG